MGKKTQNFLDSINKKEGWAWKYLYDNYFVSLCLYADNILVNSLSSKDVVQNTFIKLWEKQLSFSSEKEFSFYLYKMVYNSCLNKIRDLDNKEKKLHEWSSFESSLSDEHLLSIIKEETIRKLYLLIDTMPYMRKKVILLGLENKKVSEISEILNISENTVKKHRKIAYKFIRENLGNYRFSILFM